MAVIENSVQINRSPEDVFDYLVDLRNELEWNPDVESMEKLTNGPIGLGTKFLAKWKQSQLIEVECIRFERPLRWAYSNGGPLSVVFEVTLTPQGNRSLLSSRFDVRPHGLLRLFFPILLRELKRAEKQNMTHIKNILEKASVGNPSAQSTSGS
ncbi:MAG: SRPBCC family protein [Anaerolineae bacterium]|nr:SRPBCC family protein [Anaerolineae bacterium]